MTMSRYRLSVICQSTGEKVARPAGLEPATPGLEGRLYEPARDRPRQFPLILRPVFGVGGNCFPPDTATECHTCVPPQPFTWTSPPPSTAVGVARCFAARLAREHARERWAALTNAKLQERGRNERVDHRSYERQGIDREPGRHFGPAAAHMVTRGLDHERLREAVTIAERQDAVRTVDWG